MGGLDPLGLSSDSGGAGRSVTRCPGLVRGLSQKPSGYTWSAMVPAPLTSEGADRPMGVGTSGSVWAIVALRPV